ncbi:1-aminocyclopropane-1-carboxylate synthase-like protein 1 [Paramyrothecium foliicola]|nr:1-aminocyclopropane-1-carboxylate synthase-like protein 1 [Paramyrothecium foliicola]
MDVLDTVPQRIFDNEDFVGAVFRMRVLKKAAVDQRKAKELSGSLFEAVLWPSTKRRVFCTTGDYLQCRIDGPFLSEQSKAARVISSSDGFMYTIVRLEKYSLSISVKRKRVSDEAVRLLSGLDVPWKFAPGASARYDPVSNPEGIISFSTAENTLVHQNLSDFANKVNIPSAAFTYGFASARRLREAIAGHIEETFKPALSLNGSEIQIFQGVTALHSNLAWALAEPGEGILVTRPVYGRLGLDLGNENDVKVVYTENNIQDAMKPSIVDKMEEAVTKAEIQGTRIRAVMIVNPNNPLGRYYSREAIVEIMKFCQRRRLHLISDEVYALASFQADGHVSETLPPFTSVLSIDTQGLIDPNLVHVEYGTSKDFSAAGLRLGILITRNPAVLRATGALARFHEPSGPTVAISTAMFEDREWCRSFLDFTKEKIARAYGIATAKLRELGVEFFDANSGFFVYIDMSPWLPPPDTAPNGTLSNREREYLLAERLLAGGVFMHPGEEGALEPGRFRMVYTQQENIIELGFDRIKVVLESLPWLEKDSQLPYSGSKAWAVK